MVTAVQDAPSQVAPEEVGWDARRIAPLIVAGLAFLFLFAEPSAKLGRDIWDDPDAGHALLLIPLAFWLAWKSGIARDAAGQPVLGTAMLACAVLLRYASGLAAELFTMRLSMLAAACSLVVVYAGFRQLLRWWLPVTLLLLSIPLPAVILNSLAMPLQLQASRLGAALLEWRNVPVLLHGNVLRIPNQTLFVAEACSGLRSLSALFALGVLIGGLWLRNPLTRIVLLCIAIPVAILLNGVRVFLTGFLVHFVSPEMGQGFMHVTEGWIVFVIAFLCLGAAAWLLLRVEDGVHWAIRARRA
jgi:exosortase